MSNLKKKKALADRVKGTREKLQMTQEDLARAAGVSPRTVRRIESQEGCAVSVLRKIAGVLKLDAKQMEEEFEDAVSKRPAPRKVVLDGHDLYREARGRNPSIEVDAALQGGQVDAVREFHKIPVLAPSYQAPAPLDLFEEQLVATKRLEKLREVGLQVEAAVRVIDNRNVSDEFNPDFYEEVTFWVVPEGGRGRK